MNRTITLQRPYFRFWLAPALLLSIGSCQVTESDRGDPVNHGSVTIQRTAFGIPHVTASDWRGLGIGYGYAFAQDNLCVLAEEVIRLRGDAARYFGAGDAGKNIDGDAFYRAIRLHERAEAALSRRPTDVRALIEGYSEGLARWLKQERDQKLPCDGEPWLGAITPTDLMAHYMSLAMRSSSGQFVSVIARAAPPGTQQMASRIPGAIPAPRRESTGMGSNGWAIGSDLAAGDAGILLANPHLRWTGPDRFYEAHLTGPDGYDVMGASLYGVPVVQIGFNRDLAWTHTVSTSVRAAVYRLELVDGDPTSYVYDGELRAMEPIDVSIPVRMDDGATQTVARTLYRTHYGLVLHWPEVGLQWTEREAFALRDANFETEELVDQWLAIGRASSIQTLDDALARVQGAMWTNTIAVDRAGRTMFRESATVANLTTEQMATCIADRFALLFQLIRLPILDGATSECEWNSNPNARIPGIMGPDQAPRLERRDYVANSNDSHWVPNASARLEGYSPVFGRERMPLGLRPRLSLLMLEERANGERLTLEAVQELMLNNRHHGADLLVDELLTHYCAARAEPSLTEACGVLAAWDRRVDLDSRGALLFRTLLATPFVSGELSRAERAQPNSLFAVPFDEGDAISTPRGLKASPELFDALEASAAQIKAAGIPLDAPVRDIQFETFSGGKLPLPGGLGRNGAFNLVDGEQGADGLRIDQGSTFILAVGLSDDGPRARAILTYSQSSHPNSPHFADQTQLYLDKEWVDLPFARDDVARSAISTTELQRQ